ncbi:BTB/POZ domain-containing protein 3-like isoform X1 [Ylistrum balloti]|uniref:BTB/POZ domain-containing protein 3-like isoform X1 n=1 Tax=Ylistrum balloti TaxID=509963 RepID=UPI002905A6EE|nr:BTB/POZ domain-containing protein 3-like isoform X1 [Ylistrum balloti]
MAEGRGTAQDWRDDKSVVECHRYILEHELACDIHFKVGPPENEQQFGAHKSLLMARSNEFFTMFEEHGTEPNGLIAVPDIDAMTFKLMLLYIYCDDTIVDLNGVFHLLYAARKYKLKGLVMSCLSQIKPAIQTHRLCWVLTNACLQQDEEVKQLCLQYINLHSYVVFGSKGFLELQEDIMIEILKQDRVNMQEKDIFEAVVKWAKLKCRTNLVESNGENLRNILVNILPHVRFARMEPSYFSVKVSHMNILTQEELLENFQFLTTSKADHPDPPRDRRLLFERFCQVECGKGYFRGNADAISFMLSGNAKLHEVLVYGSCQFDALYRITVKIFENRDRTLWNKDIQLETDGYTKVYPIAIEPSVMMRKEVCYTLLMVIEGPASYYGKKGVIQKQLDGLSITFIPNEKGLNGTNIKQGQFSGFVFKKV